MHAKIVRTQLRTMAYVLRRWGGVGISAPVLWVMAEARRISVSLLELIPGMRPEGEDRGERKGYCNILRQDFITPRRRSFWKA